MKLAAILFLAVLVGVACARLVSSVKETIVEEISSAKVGQNKICFHCGEEPESEWYTSGVFYQIYPKSCKCLKLIRVSSKHMICFKNMCQQLGTQIMMVLVT